MNKKDMNLYRFYCQKKHGDGNSNIVVQKIPEVILSLSSFNNHSFYFPIYFTFG